MPRRTTVIAIVAALLVAAVAAQIPRSRGPVTGCSGIGCVVKAQQEATRVLEAPQCVPTCENIYNTTAACDFDPSCEWSIVDNRCYTKCSTIRRQEHCDVNSTWRTTYRTAGRIWNSSRHCYWDHNEAKCFTRCNHLGLHQCPNNTYCMNYDNRLCLHRCNDIDRRAGNNFADADFSQVPVEGVDNVTWDGISIDDRRVLCRISYEGQCTYHGLRRTCVPSCPAKHRDNMTSCGIDPDCIAVNTTLFTQRCADGCHLFTSKTICGVNESSHCTWSPARDRCEMRCDLMFHYDNVTTCAGHALCDTFGTHLYGLENQLEACPTSSTGCNVLRPKTHCRQNCSAFDGFSSECKAYAGGTSTKICDYIDIAGFNLCVQGCNNANDEATCGTMQYCRWSARQQTCQRRCESVTNTSCTTYSNCRVGSDLLCTTECAEVTFSATLSAFQAACSANNRCEMTSRNECRDICSSLGPASCETEMRCVLVNGVCATSCTAEASLQNSEAACSAQPRCAWNAAVGCFDRCSLLSSTRCGHAGNPMCRTNPNNTAECISQCSLLSATACAADPACETTNAGLECQVRCAYFSNTTCGIYWYNQGCVWANTSLPGAAACQMRCSYKHGNDVTSCDNDGNCEYFSGNGCQQACSTLNNVNHTSMCDNTAGCSWRLGACRPKCDEKYRTQAGCDADNWCQWNGGQCEIRCSRYSNETECEAETTNCGWVYTTGTCETLCPIKHVTQSACDGDSLCQWAPHGCATRCTALNYTYCGTTRFGKGCSQASGETCIAPCEDRSSQAACQTDSNCQWFERFGVCRTSCATLDLEACRLTYPICNWHGYNRKCYGNCADRALTEAACTPLSECSWYNDTQRCVPKCTTLGYEQCRVEDHCNWQVSTSSCMTINCTSRSNTQCAADGLCAWHASARECYPACSTFNETSCSFYNTHCTWNYHNLTCELGCSFAYTNLTVLNTTERNAWEAFLVNNSVPHNLNLTDVDERYKSACASMWRCDYNLRNTGVCDTACQALPITSCNVLNGCYNGVLAGCQNYVRTPGVRACTSTLVTQAQCETSNVCSWLNGTNRCTPVCAKYNGLAHYGKCVADTFCTPASVDTCVDRCSIHTDAWMCQNNTRCAWTGTLCRIDCKAFATCGNTSDWSHCFYNHTSSTCDNDCSALFTTQGPCENHAGCEWIDRSNRCSRKCAGLDAFDCASETYCQWMSGESRCYANCFNKHQSASACYNDTTCYWNPTSARCATRCENLNATECSSESLCAVRSFGTFAQAQCVRACYNSGFGNAARMDFCAAQNCAWFPQLGFGTCGYNCSQYLNVSDCTADTRCQYNHQVGACQRICIQRFDNVTHMQAQCSTETDCEAYPSSASCYQVCEQRPKAQCALYNFACELNGDQCHTRCRRLTSQTACDANAYCTWTANSFCSDCSLRTNSTSCLESTQCGYAGQWSGTCYDVCEWSPANNSAACNALTNSGCIFQDNQCITVCSMLTFDVCRRTPRCRLNQAAGKCEESCAVKHTTQAACDADGDCMSLPSAGSAFSICTEKCARLSYVDCVSQFRCQWSRAQDVCEVRCNLVYYPVVRNTTDPAACIADTSCVLIGTGASQQCRQNCNRFSSGTDCTANFYCFWSDAAKRCENRCNWRRVAPDFYETNFTYNASATNTPVPTPTQQQQMNQAGASQSGYASACDVDTYCVTDFAVNGSFFPQCLEDCALYSTATTCPTTSHCKWLGDQLGCQQGCLSKFGLNDTLCNAHPRCEFDFQTYKCKEKCVAFDTLDSCESQTTHCVWKRGRCMLGCATAYALNSSHQCSLSDSTCDARRNSASQRCTERCDMFETQARCIARGVDCLWQNGFLPNTTTGQCLRRCNFYSVEDDCVGDTSCEWHPTISSCRTKCSLYQKAACTGYCEWAHKSDKCVYDCSLRFRSLNDTYVCDSNPYCELLGAGNAKSRCALKCSERTTATTCYAESDCRWNSRLGVCHQRCTREFNHSVALCEASPHCRWFYDYNRCDDDCSNVVSRTACDSTSVILNSGSPRCYWSLQGGCQMRCDDRTTNRTKCEADPECVWSTVLNKCRTQCDAKTSYWTCEASVQPYCAWLAPYATQLISVEVLDFNETQTRHTISWWFDLHHDNVSVTTPFVACNRTFVEAVVVGDYDRIHNMTSTINYWAETASIRGFLNSVGIYNLRVGAAQVPTDVSLNPVSSSVTSAAPPRGVFAVIAALCAVVVVAAVL